MKLKHKFLIKQLAEMTFVGDEKSINNRIKEVCDFLFKNFTKEVKSFIKYYEFCLKQIYIKNYIEVCYASECPDSVENVLNSIIDGDFFDKIVKKQQRCLIGGFKIKHGDFIYDASIEGQLDSLSKYLN